MDGNRLRPVQYRPWWKRTVRWFRAKGMSLDGPTCIQAQQTRVETFWKWFTRLGGQALLWLYIACCVAAGHVISFADFRAFLAHLLNWQTKGGF